MKNYRITFDRCGYPNSWYEMRGATQSLFHQTFEKAESEDKAKEQVILKYQKDGWKVKHLKIYLDE